MTVVLKRKYEVTRKTMFGEEVVHSEFTTETCDVCGDTGYVHVHYYESASSPSANEARRPSGGSRDTFGDGEERALCQDCEDPSDDAEGR